jgi:hypothetical protein
MPTYGFKNKKTGEEFETFMSMGERDIYLKEHPEIEPLISFPAIVSGVDGLRKPDDSFRDILRNIKKKHKGSNRPGSPNQNTMNKNADF